jgi:dUTP pyrophosphatase
MKIKIKKLRENAKLPVREHSMDAGMDFFYCPESGKEINRNIFPNTSAILQTGVKVEVPKGYMLEIKNKGGIAANRQLIVGSCVVDHGYTGEIFVNLHNIGQDVRSIKPGDKLAQGVFVKIETDIVLVESEEIYDLPTERGDGKLGSTGV